MNTTNRTILVGFLAVCYGYLTDISAYMSGIMAQGGSYTDFEPLALLPLTISALSTGIAALMTLLAEPPPGKRLLTTPVDNISIPDVDLGPAK